MTYHLRSRWAVPDSEYELQQIDGSDGSVWIRIGSGAGLLAVFSAAKQGAGVMPKARVVNVLAEAATARNPPVIVNALRFIGWEFWPAMPAPLKNYLRQDFPAEVGRVEVTNAFG